MIVIKVEMWPGGDQRKAYEFGRAVLINQEERTVATKGSRGDYFVRLWGGVSGKRVLLSNRPWRQGFVRDFPRQQLGAWHLICQALKEVLNWNSLKMT
jgi:hypothetical protein